MRVAETYDERCVDRNERERQILPDSYFEVASTPSCMFVMISTSADNEFYTVGERERESSSLQWRNGRATCTDQTDFGFEPDRGFGHSDP